jgi:amino acid permease
MAVVVFFLSLLPDLSSAWQISFLGFVSAIVIILFAAIVPIIVIASGENEDVTYGRPTGVDTNLDFIMGVFGAIGNFIFAWGYHVIMPDIQASLHDHDTADAHRDMTKATTFAYSISTPFFIMISVLGYAAFGADVADDVLDSFSGYVPDAALFALWLFIIFKVATEGSVFNQGAFTLIRDIFGLAIEDDHVDHHPRNKKLDFFCRFLWVAATTLVAIYLPLVSAKIDRCQNVVDSMHTYIQKQQNLS